MQKSKVIYVVRDRKSVYSLSYGGNVWRSGAPSCVAWQPNHHRRPKLRSDKGRWVPVARDVSNTHARERGPTKPQPHAQTHAHRPSIIINNRSHLPNMSLLLRQRWFPGAWRPVQSRTAAVDRRTSMKTRQRIHSSPLRHVHTHAKPPSRDNPMRRLCRVVHHPP